MAREIINVCIKNDVDFINTFYGQNKRLLKSEDSMTYSKNCAM